MDCVYCGSQRAITYGTRGGVQQYRCKECGRQFNKRSGTPFAGMKYTPQEVVLALRLRFNYRLSCREVSELMAEIGHPVSPATILFWTGRFNDSFQTLQRMYRPEYSWIWHVDELQVGSGPTWSTLAKALKTRLPYRKRRDGDSPVTSETSQETLNRQSTPSTKCIN